ncbi:class I tRNA ligase family protein [Patescibacteria group bacterium]|nr:class I tRNA ligase family protein [Candidatus Falkowbacteria bacterium]MBU3906017.1 class I tRNA ligase family protein [Patescibacteria group bacterium]MBU4015090.1 class I tRNA ligase family protein [Patescibacteria group bacterium]MBU4026776.1 class I tRNA ligase family protein [Patescibacteria group bacterium]MBU4073284.1 class I tRNA ligase family protein [Patescibacteria group bacterium]
MYNHQKIEKKWAEKWVKDKTFTPDLEKAKDPYYALFMFPYPSAEGLHIGNFYAFTCVDVMAKYKKLQGKDVFEPIGFDAFGIHSENYALKINETPRKMLNRTIANFRNQLSSAGLGCDWTREVDTTDPEYYKWTQWIFTKLFEKGLAYQKEALLNWCPGCKTVLADEQIENGVCERCKTAPEKKIMKQWFFRITAYAQRLLDGLETMDWSDITKHAQRNWIGRSEGASVKFQISNSKLQTPQHRCATTGQANSKSEISNFKYEIEVFTTRPDTLFGATYFVMSPEHPLVEKITSPEQKKEVEKYIKKTGAKSDLERAEAKEKTGVFTGAHAINPVNNEKIPVWIADYVLMGYGTGAIMAVPAHDERDFEFAEKYNLPIRQVVAGKTQKHKNTKTQKHCLIIHGSPRCDKSKDTDYTPDNIKHWLGWLKKRLENNNYKVYNPQMPTPWEPDYQEWKKQIDKLDINENSVIVGHSAGGAFAVRWLSENKKKIDKLILIAAGKTITDDNKRLHNFYDFKINQNIKNRVNKIIIFVSEDEKKYRIASAKLYQKELGGELRILKDRGHFTVTANPINKEFPELLEEILKDKCFVGDGININSDFLNGLETEQAKEKMIKWLEENELGKGTVNYKLRDWCISRQRYWGPPVPIVYCNKCGVQAVPEKDLPVELPEMEKGWEPVGDGRGPLAKVNKFIKTVCPKCGGSAEREPDVMDNFLDSAWYYFRYVSPRDNKNIFDKKLSKKWLPVDLYVGGNEHAVLHLMYTRFIAMALHDLGLTDFDNPFKKFRANGMILKDGKKMSKSKGNVVNPEEYGAKVGYDALKTYLLFLGPLNEDRSFSDSGVQGAKRWMERIDRLEEKINNNYEDDKKIIKKLHQTIKAVTDDFEEQKYNTAVARLMKLTNSLSVEKNISGQTWEKFLILVAPFAPALAEELWSSFAKATDDKAERFKQSIFKAKWPKHNPKLIKDDIINLVIQINGKLRDTIETPINISEKEAQKIALESDKIKKWTNGKKIIKVIFVKGKLINIVIK